jgi:hypothetical protein
MRGEQETFLWQTEQHGWGYMIGVCFISTGMARFPFWWISWEVLGVTGYAHAQGAGTG